MTLLQELIARGIQGQKPRYNRIDPETIDAGSNIEQ